MGHTSLYRFSTQDLGYKIKVKTQDLAQKIKANGHIQLHIIFGKIL